MKDLLRDKLKEIFNLKNIIKTVELNCKPKFRKVYNFGEYSLPIAFLGNTHEGYLSLQDADDKLRNFAAKLKNLDKGNETIEKILFSK